MQRSARPVFFGARFMRMIAASVMMLVLAAQVRAQAKPVPLLQALPQPNHQISFQRDGQEIARMHFGSQLRRPFLYPIIGPSGRSLTRIGHPHDPEGHSHHNSVWISHHEVEGVGVWGDKGKGRTAHQRTEKIEDEGDRSWVITHNVWLDETSNKPLLWERRRTQVQLLENREWLLILSLTFAAKTEIELGKTPFG